MTSTHEIGPLSLDLFMALARDAGNWSGTPLLGGNVTITKELRGNLTDLKRRNLLTTFKDEGLVWVAFTEKGRELASQNGVTIA